MKDAQFIHLQTYQISRHKTLQFSPTFDFRKPHESNFSKIAILQTLQRSPTKTINLFDTKTAMER